MQNEHAIKQPVFLDDRVLVAPTVRDLMIGWRSWQNWSRKLGLVENSDMVSALAQTSYQQHAFERAGIPIQQIHSQMRILGVDYVVPGFGQVGEAGEARIASAVHIAKRLARLPVSVKVRRALYRRRVIPKACWGWWFHRFPDFALNQLFSIFRKIGYVQKMASRDLFSMLEGPMGHQNNCQITRIYGLGSC